MSGTAKWMDAVQVGKSLCEGTWCSLVPTLDCHSGNLEFEPLSDLHAEIFPGLRLISAPLSKINMEGCEKTQGAIALNPTSSHRSYPLTVIVMFFSLLWVTEYGLWLAPCQKLIPQHCQGRLFPGMISTLHLEALGICEDGVALSYWSLVGRCRVQILGVLKCHNWGCLKCLQVDVGVKLGTCDSQHPSRSLHICHNHLFSFFIVAHHVQLKHLFNNMQIAHSASRWWGNYFINSLVVNSFLRQGFLLCRMVITPQRHSEVCCQIALVFLLCITHFSCTLFCGLLCDYRVRSTGWHTPQDHMLQQQAFLLLKCS